MDVVGVVFVFIIILVLMCLLNYQIVRSVLPIARPRNEATLPMGPEGFANMSLQQWLPSPEVVTKPAVGSCPGTLMNAANYEGIKGMYKNYDLVADYIPAKDGLRIAAGPTSQQCFERDWTRGLERAGSYAQRTNNYKHGTPDSCSAPNHDLILDFYKAKPSPGPYQL